MSSLVAVDSVLSLSLWASIHVSISSVLIQNLTGYSTLRGMGICFFLFANSFYTEMIVVVQSAAVSHLTCGFCSVALSPTHIPIHIS